MSVTSSRRIASARPSVSYDIFGTRGSARYKQHLLDRTDRIAAMRCDAATPQEFVERAEALAQAHGRKIEARALIQSFESLDAANPDHVQAANDAGYLLAKRLHPNSDALVITHIDGAGGHVHNHIKVINHDNETARALDTNNLHWHTARVNDELMAQLGLPVTQKGSRTQDQGAYWEGAREGAGVSDFDRMLGDTIEEALADRRSKDTASFRQVLASKGVQLESRTYTIKDEKVEGWTYVAQGRRRKASGLSAEFTHAGTQKVFEAKARPTSLRDRVVAARRQAREHDGMVR